MLPRKQVRAFLAGPQAGEVCVEDRAPARLRLIGCADLLARTGSEATLEALHRADGYPNDPRASSCRARGDRGAIVAPLIGRRSVSPTGRIQMLRWAGSTAWLTASARPV